MAVAGGWVGLSTKVSVDGPASLHREEELKKKTTTRHSRTGTPFLVHEENEEVRHGEGWGPPSRCCLVWLLTRQAGHDESKEPALSPRAWTGMRPAEILLRPSASVDGLHHLPPCWWAGHGLLGSPLLAY